MKARMEFAGKWTVVEVGSNEILFSSERRDKCHQWLHENGFKFSEITSVFEKKGKHCTQGIKQHRGNHIAL